MKFRIGTVALSLWLAVVANASELRDPMRPGGTPTAARTAMPARPVAVHALKLEGVIAGQSRVAIVNGRLVRAGDMVAGARILEVLATAVRYERAGKIQTLSLATAPAHSNVRVARSDKKP
jgi:hypothetical protein